MKRYEWPLIDPPWPLNPATVSPWELMQLKKEVTDLKKEVRDLKEVVSRLRNRPLRTNDEYRQRVAHALGLDYQEYFR